MMNLGGTGHQGSRMRQFSRVWIEDENGKLQLVFIRTGVTDNSYIQVVWGNLKEGQEVITGKGSTNERSGSSRSNIMRGMYMMRR